MVTKRICFSFLTFFYPQRVVPMNFYEDFIFCMQKERKKLSGFLLVHVLFLKPPAEVTMKEPVCPIT